MKHTWWRSILHLLFGHCTWFGLYLEYGEFDGASHHARCRYCGYKGMIDSQGNLF